MIRLVPIADIEPDAIEMLLDRAFGRDRHRRTAYRVRAGIQPIPALSFAALLPDSRLAGTIQCWPVALATDDGAEVPMVMVGPVAVEPDLQRDGIGRVLMTHMLEAARSCDDPGADALMLVGDPEYYGRFFGFSSERTGRWRLPGPFERHRLMARGAVPARAGMLGPRIGSPGRSRLPGAVPLP